MKISCGVDIIEIDRVKESIEQLGDKFLNRGFTDKEIEYCESRKNQKYQHYAARFAAKEAAFKAVSGQIDDKYNVCWKDFEVTNDEQGRPSIKLVGIDEKSIEKNVNVFSHPNLYALAHVTVLYK